MTSTNGEIPISLYGRLTTDKKSKIDNLKELLKDHSEEQCFNLLEANFWNIEASIDSLNQSKSEAVGVSSIDSFTGIFNVEAGPSNKTIIPKHIANEILIPDYVERIYHQPFISKELHPWLFKIIMWTSKPLNLAFSTFNFILKYLFFRRRTEKITPEILNQCETKLMEDLSSSLLIPNSDTGAVTLFLGNFEEAVAQAKYEYKFLLVYLHSLGDPNAEEFLNNSFLHLDVVQLLNDPENILIWAGNLNNPEGEEVSKLLKIRQENCHKHADEYFSNPLQKLFESPNIPFLFSLLSICSNSHGIKLTVIGQLEKSIKPTELRDTLNKWIEIGSRPRLIAKREKNSRDAVVNLRKMQDIAFYEMLERDQLQEAKIHLKMNNEKQVSINKEHLRRKLKEIPNFSLNHENNFKCVIQLLIKMQNGRRFDYNFDITSSIKLLYCVVYAQEDAPNNFEVLWNYPHQVLQCKPQTITSDDIDLAPRKDDPPTFLSQGIINNQVILVRDLDS